jgi:DNA-binding response OmpR family regulator
MASGKVLVLDADDVALEATRQALEAAGYDVPILRTPFLLFEALHEETPDALVMEIEVPQIRGDKILEILNGFGAVDGVAVLFYSSLPEAEGWAFARGCGAYGYVPKAAGHGLLLARVKEAIEQSQADRVRVQLA